MLLCIGTHFDCSSANCSHWEWDQSLLCENGFLSQPSTHSHILSVNCSIIHGPHWNASDKPKARARELERQPNYHYTCRKWMNLPFHPLHITNILTLTLTTFESRWAVNLTFAKAICHGWRGTESSVYQMVVWWLSVLMFPSRTLAHQPFLFVPSSNLTSETICLCPPPAIHQSVHSHHCQETSRYVSCSLSVLRTSQARLSHRWMSIHMVLCGQR